MDSTTVSRGLWILGSFTLLSVTIQACRFVWDLVLPPNSLLSYRSADGNSWALVTGASDGIGRGFAEELLERGFNVVLHGRNAQKLKLLQDELRSRNPGRQVETVIADASRGDHPEDEVVHAVDRVARGRLNVLVNNVGGVTTNPEFSPLSRQCANDVDTMLNLNCRFPLQLTRALLPRMSHGPALIMNVSSITVTMGTPYLVTYAGCKGLTHSATLSLREELAAERSQVEVMAVVAGNTLSGKNRSDVPGVTISSRQCAKGALSRVKGTPSAFWGPAFVFAHWRHSIPFYLLSSLPDWIMQSIIVDEMRGRIAAEKREAAPSS